MDSRTFTSSDVSRIAQVSLRQLQWWASEKSFPPQHEGHKRVYQSEEVIEITVIAGAPPQGLLPPENPAGFAISSKGDGQAAG